MFRTKISPFLHVNVLPLRSHFTSRVLLGNPTQNVSFTTQTSSSSSASLLASSPNQCSRGATLLRFFVANSSNSNININNDNTIYYFKANCLFSLPVLVNQSRFCTSSSSSSSSDKKSSPFLPSGLQYDPDDTSSFENRPPEDLVKVKELHEILSTNIINWLQKKSRRNSPYDCTALISLLLEKNIHGRSVQLFLIDLENIRSKNIDTMVAEVLLHEELFPYLQYAITQESIQQLIPGQAFRHTALLPYGMVARQATLKKIMAFVANVEKIVQRRFSIEVPSSEKLTKEQSAVGYVIGIPRQGKTLLLDCVANNVQNILGKVLTKRQVYTFNITLNANWQVVEKLASAKDAERLMMLRIFAAALGCFRADDTQMLGTFVQRLFKLENQLDRPLDQLRDLILKRLVALTDHNNRNNDVDACAHVEPPFILLLVDEATALSERLNNEEDANTILSSLNQLTSPNAAVILSGFVSGGLERSQTGRKIFAATLPPLSVAQLRRNASPMTTLYFQTRPIPDQVSLTASAFTSTETNSFSVDTKENAAETNALLAIYYYELLKSSAGLLGAVLEEAIKNPQENIKNVLQAIPVLTKIKANSKQATVIVMINVLRWKSIQFLCGDQNTFLCDDNDDSFTAKMIKSCQRGALEKLVYLPKGVQVRWFDNHADDLKLAYVVVEPMMLFDMTPPSSLVHGLKEFNEKLEIYSKCIIAMCLLHGPSRNLVLKNEDSLTAEKARHFLQAAVLNRFSRSTLLVLSANDNSKNHNSIEAENLNHGVVTGYFFEDAVACGISAQKELRRKLFSSDDAQRCPESLEVLLEYFLYGAEFEFTTTTTSEDKKSPIVPDLPIRLLTESCEEKKNEKFIKYFENHFPSRNWNNNNAAPPLIDKQPIHTFFDTSHVLCPSRPENNPLVDIIFHELASRSGNANNKNNNNNNKTSNPSDELIQFWVDAKHRHGRQESLNQAADTFAATVSAAVYRMKSNHQNIKHIVHVIITCAHPTTASRDDLRAQFRHHFQHLSPSTGVPSYTLCFLHPDALGFENLVSQPIARSVPLMDQQHLESWRQRLGDWSLWKKYKTTTNFGLEKMLTGDKKECFSEWRHLRMQDDSISRLPTFSPSKIQKKSDFQQSGSYTGDHFVADLQTILAHHGDSSPTRTSISPSTTVVPFGLALEACGIITRRDGDNKHYVGSSFLRHLNICDPFERLRSIIVDSPTSSSSSSSSSSLCQRNTNEPLKSAVKRFGHYMEANITVGHLLQDDDSWMFFFNVDFSKICHDTLENSLGLFHSRPISSLIRATTSDTSTATSAADTNAATTPPSDIATATATASNNADRDNKEEGVEFAVAVWNMPISRWLINSQKFDKEHGTSPMQHYPDNQIVKKILLLQQRQVLHHNDRPSQNKMSQSEVWSELVFVLRFLKSQKSTASSRSSAEARTINRVHDFVEKVDAEARELGKRIDKLLNIKS